MPGDYLQNQNDYVEAGYIGNEGSRVSFFALGTVYGFDRDPQRHSRSRGLLQSSVVGSGAERIGRSFYVKNDLIELIWPSLNAFDRDKIISLWLSVRAMAKTFSFTDVNGYAYTVRFARPDRPSVREKAFDSYEIKIQLRVI